MPFDLFDPVVLFAYLGAASLLVLAPGPSQALVIARSISGGIRAGVLTSAGCEIGTLVHTVAAALGLSAILATSATAFNIVKYLGAIYLVVLGVSVLRRAGRHAVAATPAAGIGRRDSAARLLLHGALTGTLNPKVALFFLAFLPQFVDPARGSVLIQFLLLGAILSLLGFAWDALLAVTAGGAGRRLSASARFNRWRDRLTGAVLIGLGLRLAFAERR